MALRGVVWGNRIELETDTGLPDGTMVQVELKPVQESHLLKRLCQFWNLEQVEPTLTLEEARRLAAHGLSPCWASRQILEMRNERGLGKQ